MTPKEAFEYLLMRIDGMDASTVTRPIYKIGNRVVEGQRLFKVGDAHHAAFETLASVGVFDMFNLDELDTAALALRHAEAEWLVMSNPGRSEDFVERIERLKTLRTMLLRDLDYVAVRFTPEGLARTLSKVKEGSSQADLLQDAATIGTLCDKHAADLARIGFDAAAATEAVTLSAELGPQINADPKALAQAKNRRDRAAALLEKMMQEVRDAARFIFRNNAELLVEFQDQGR